MPQFFAFEGPLAVSTASKSLTAATYKDASYAVITVETAAIRYRLDSVAPSSTAGHAANAGDRVILNGINEVIGFRVVRRDATDSALHVSYGHT